MPLRNKFELLSLVGRKKHAEEAPPPPPPAAPSSSYTSSRPPYQSGFQRSAAIPPAAPPQPSAAPTRDGFYTAVQYERLTPSVTQRPPVLGGSSASSAASSRSASFHSTAGPSAVQYERLTPSSARLPSPPVQYERLTPSSARLPSPPVQYGLAPSAARLPSPQYDRLTPTASPAGGVSPIPSLHVARSATFPSPNVPSPNVLHSPVEIAPLRIDSLRRERKNQRANSNLASVAENGPADATMEASANGATPNSGSDKSTPFSLVMEEWMSQLRTPTPDVMLLPSPYDFNKGTPTPVEKMEDIRHIHEALLPTPPPDVHDQRQVEDIASLCRDLITQEVSEQIAKRLIKMGAFPPSTTYTAAKQALAKAVTPGAARAASENGDDYDDDQFDDASSMGGAGKGKRRKMCTAEGCQNLSRSRGLCKAHGGGRRCSVEGCSRASQSGSLCITHGGGKRCTVEGCHKAAQSRGMCKAHGGGVRCRVEGCTKSSQGDGFCRTHGGGRRCGHPSGCQKWAQRNGMCMAHSEGRYGNSYRGRVARMVGEDGEDEYVGGAAEALVKAANAAV